MLIIITILFERRKTRKRSVDPFSIKEHIGDHGYIKPR
jgi:hypothetical protein